VAIASGGAYLVYVVLTCLFYFVGLAYDNVPEAALLVLFVGGVEAVLHLARRTLINRAPAWSFEA